MPSMAILRYEFTIRITTGVTTKMFSPFFIFQSLSETGRKIHFRCGIGRAKGRAWCGVSELPNADAESVERSVKKSAS